jgi:hypothetical protein
MTFSRLFFLVCVRPACQNFFLDISDFISPNNQSYCLSLFIFLKFLLFFLAFIARRPEKIRVPQIKKEATGEATGFSWTPTHCVMGFSFYKYFQYNSPTTNQPT